MTPEQIGKEREKFEETWEKDTGAVALKLPEEEKAWSWHFWLECAKSYQEEIERLKEALKKISEGKGRYDMNNHQHAINTIEDMKKIAIKALEAK